MNYIPADKLLAEIERRKNQSERRLNNIVPIRRKDTMDEEQLAKIELRDKVDRAYLNGVLVTLSDVLSFITPLQQEQPEVELEREIIKYKVPFSDDKEHLNEQTLDAIASHFYELGQCTKYQQDRAEFAKLKAKEWQEGYDEGYAKGLNARKEETK